MFDKNQIKKPCEVFLPKSIDPSGNIIIREDLEEVFKEKLQTSWKQVIITGISGSWKSWLYKICLKDQYEFLDLAQIGGTSTKNLDTLVDEKIGERETSYSETKWAEYNAALAKWNLAHTGNFAVSNKDWLIRILEKAKRNKKKYIVLENLENVKDREDVLSDICNHIISIADSDDYRDFWWAKIIIVATQRGADKFWIVASSGDKKTIRSRLEQIKVDALTSDEIEKYTIQGFKSCWISIQYIDLQEKLRWFTGGIANEVADFCLKLWNYAIKSKKDSIDTEVFEKWRTEWIQSLYEIQAVDVYSMMNTRERQQRRNQVLYTIWMFENLSFKTSEVEKKLREHFPSVSGNLQLTQVLDTLVAKQLLIKDDADGKKTNVYSFEDPVNKFILRNTLEIDSEWKVNFTLKQ